MAPESSRKTEPATSLAPGGCPRCGTRLSEPYKYCPHCSYRLRPDLFPAPHVAVAGAPLSQRVVALGGYLLFASMLLLVVFVGVRLFAQPQPPDLVRPQVMRARDAPCLALTLDEFVAVPAGTAFWGPYDPGREYATGSRTEAAAEETETAERAARTLDRLMSEAIAPEEVDETRRELRAALARFPSVRDAMRQWAGAFDAAKETEAAKRVEKALERLRSETTKPREVDEALADLRTSLEGYPSARDAIRHFADAFDVVVPHEAVEGTPYPYQVDDSFRMSRHEVTNDQYFEFLRARAKKSGRPVSKHLIPADWKRATGSPDVPKIYNVKKGDFPVVGVSVDAALEFCGWFWEERLGADPDLVVDLPTWKEYILAARGDRLLYNFPWGRALHEGKNANLGGVGLWSVVFGPHGGEKDPQPREPGESYNGFFDLVGNAAEWVYWRDERGLIVAAGWSHEDTWVYKVNEGEGGQPARLSTPFSDSGFRVIASKEGLNDVGFRPVIRRALALPSFVPVTAGTVRHQPCPDDLLAPERLDAEESDEHDANGPETLEEVRARREPAVLFAAGTERVERDFEIAATETTNRQYLAFLAAIAPGHTKDDLLALVPRGWRRLNRLIRHEGEGEDRHPVPRAYDGYFVPWERLETIYTAGQENVPVQGITIDQAQEYATWLSGRLGHRCAIPTVGQYLRAGRGDGIAPYPWGDDRNGIELLSCYRPEDPRAYSLLELLSPLRPVVGLAGNVGELVSDESSGGRILVAGGFYRLPARLCTLDCFLDTGWDSVQYVLQPEDILPEDELDLSDPTAPKLSDPFGIGYHTGFRVVRLHDPF